MISKYPKKLISWMSPRFRESWKMNLISPISMPGDFVQYLMHCSIRLHNKMIDPSFRMRSHDDLKGMYNIGYNYW